jgi:cytochrome c oxidase subunit 2
MRLIRVRLFEKNKMMKQVMEMKKMNILFGLLIAGMLLLTGCTIYGSTGTTQRQDNTTVSPQVAQTPYSSSGNSGGGSYYANASAGDDKGPVKNTGGNSAGLYYPNATSGDDNGKGSAGTKEFTVTAEQFDFSPSTITVHKGDKVVLLVKSADSTHGIAIPDFGISQALPPGQQERIEFTADKVGTFAFFCNVPCGPGHGEMKGQIVVEA